MAGTTITGTYLVGITLSNPATQDPATITGTGSVDVTAASGSALYGPNTAAWSIYNSGALIAPTRGVFLAAGGTVANFASGVISGGARGVDVTGGSGTILNAGSIDGGSQQGIRLLSGGTVSNASGGTISGGGTYAGIDILQGGVVTNAAGGAIADGVAISGSAGTITNDGSIGSTPPVGPAIRLAAGGIVTNGGSVVGGIYLAAATGTVTNSGSIVRGSTGISLMAGGVINNAASGLIDVGGAVNLYLHGGTVVNAGQIGQPDATGPVSFPGLGIYDKHLPIVITNQSGGLIASANGGVYVRYATATLINAGTITGYQPSKGAMIGGAIGLQQGGVVTNLPSGVITAAIQAGGITSIDNAGYIGGVNLLSGTLVNTGTIHGDAYVGSAAYTPDGSYNNDRLVLDPAAVLGQAHTGNTVSSVLELASGSSAGTLAGFGTTVRNFSTVQFDPFAAWTIAGSPAGLSGVLSHFDVGDTIDLIGLNETIQAYAAGILTLTGDQTVMLNLPNPVTQAAFLTSSDAGTGTDVFLACFARGTRVTTPIGEVAVEALSEGDTVLLASGEIAPVVWIGHRRLDCQRHPQPKHIWPVRVRAHAFGRNLPRRDLLLSPDHAVFIEEVLIPIRYLINGTAIRQEQCQSVEYFHIELPHHAILLAEGLPAESYLDTGDRSSFANGVWPMQLHPDFASRVWEAAACAPLCVTGAKLAKVRRRLARHAKRGVTLRQYDRSSTAAI